MKLVKRKTIMKFRQATGAPPMALVGYTAFDQGPDAPFERSYDDDAYEIKDFLQKALPRGTYDLLCILMTRPDDLPKPRSTPK